MKGLIGRYGMLTARTWRIGGLALLIVVVATACANVPQAPQAVATQEEPAAAATRDQPAVAETGIVVTVDGDRCVYLGPGHVPAGRIRVILDMRDESAYESYFVAVVTLDEGKTIEDLAADPMTSGLPLWTHDHGGVEAPQGAIRRSTVILSEGPMFLVCLAKPPEQTTNVLGPIEIDPGT